MIRHLPDAWLPPLRRTLERLLPLDIDNTILGWLNAIANETHRRDVLDAAAAEARNYWAPRFEEDA